MKLTRKALMTFGTVLLFAIPALAHPVPPGVGHFTGAGTIVTSFNIGAGQITVVDNGAVVCQDTSGDGIPDHGRGGVCIRFADFPAGANAIYVHDATVPDNKLAFQVCVDNDGDGLCAGGNSEALNQITGCYDVVYFSHDSGTDTNHNPLYIPHASLQANYQACGGNPTTGRQGFPGYIVITCAGFHDNRQSTTPHQHDVTSGTASPAFTNAQGHGDFCGAPTAAKAYEVI